MSRGVAAAAAEPTAAAASIIISTIRSRIVTFLAFTCRNECVGIATWQPLL
jgi:hypothetical protein